MNDLKKYFLFVAIFCFAAAAAFSQELQIRDIKPGTFFTQNSKSIHLTETALNISDERGQRFNRKISGRKIFHFSPSKKYLLVCNFNFPKEKTSYSISIFLFDEKFELVKENILEAFYDMPHQIFAVNDEGIISAYDPASMELTLFGNESAEKILLEEKINYEMERAAFLAITNSDLFIATNLQPVVLEGNQANSAIYKIDLSDNSSVKRAADLSVVTFLNLSDDKLFLSGVKFADAFPEERTIQMDLNLNGISILPFQINHVFNVESVLYGRTSQKIIELTTQPREAADFQSLGNFANHTTSKNFSPFFLLKKDGQYAIADLNIKAENDIEGKLLSAYFEADFIREFINDDRIFYLFTNAQTYILQ